MTPPATTPTGARAYERDQLLTAAIKFISDLTGMKPPPIEVAPAAVFAPFHAFVDEVQGIVSESRGPAGALEEPATGDRRGACGSPRGACGLPCEPCNQDAARTKEGLTISASATPANASAGLPPPVIYIDATGELVSRVSGEQVESVLGPVVDDIRARMARQAASANHYAGEGPISALYRIRYFASTLAEAQTIAGDAMDTARQRTAAARKAEPAPQASVLPSEPLWDRKGNVNHAAVDRLGAAQRAAAASVASSQPIASAMAAPGTWVCNGERVAKVRAAHAPDEFDPAGFYDLVLHARDGKRIGRESPAMDGPRGYEPFCTARVWRSIEAPRFPLPRYGELDGHVQFTDAQTDSPDSAGESAESGDPGDQDSAREAPRT